MEAQGQATPQATQETTTPEQNAQGKAIAGVQAAQGSQNPGQNLASDAAKEAMRKFKIKYDDGNEEELAEEEALKIVRERKSHQRAANKILQEGKTAKKQAEEFIAMMKDPRKAVEVLKRLGHDPRKMSEEYLAEVLAEEMMDPKEKELKATKTKLQEYEEREKREKEELEKRELAEMTKKISEKYVVEFKEAIAGTKLPPNKETVRRMAEYVGRCAKMGYEITANEAATMVLQDIEALNAAILRDADPETIVRLLGDQGLQKVRGYDTSKLKSPEAGLKTPTEQAEPNQRARNSGKRMTPKEWREFNRK